jgi:hypothetical protein
MVASSLSSNLNQFAGEDIGNGYALRNQLIDQRILGD